MCITHKWAPQAMVSAALVAFPPIWKAARQPAQSTLAMSGKRNVTFLIAIYVLY